MPRVVVAHSPGEAMTGGGCPASANVMVSYGGTEVAQATVANVFISN